MKKIKNMTPQEIVNELDKYIIGQADAKRNVAIALRNRWRRMNVEDEIKNEIIPNNILMIGAPIINILFGIISFLISSSTFILLHLFLNAIATFLFASAWPIIYLSNSLTISCGVMFLIFFIIKINFF